MAGDVRREHRPGVKSAAAGVRTADGEGPGHRLRGYGRRPAVRGAGPPPARRARVRRRAHARSPCDRRRRRPLQAAEGGAHVRLWRCSRTSARFAVVGPNAIGLYNVMDAAPAVKRVVLASSMMVVWGGRGPVSPGVGDRRPNNHYARPRSGQSRWGELYTRRFGYVLAMRLGWTASNPGRGPAHDRARDSSTVPPAAPTARAPSPPPSRPKASPSRLSHGPPAAAASACSTWSRRGVCSVSRPSSAGPRASRSHCLTG